jgi:RNA polymerase sigma factor (sigma-70 family)
VKTKIIPLGGSKIGESAGVDSLIRAIKSGDKARDTLFEMYLPCVEPIARSYRGSTVPFEDLYQQGALGVLAAIDKYRPNSKRTFVEFMEVHVRASIEKLVNEKRNLVYSGIYKNKKSQAPRSPVVQKRINRIVWRDLFGTMPEKDKELLSALKLKDISQYID